MAWNGQDLLLFFNFRLLLLLVRMEAPREQHVFHLICSLTYPKHLDQGLAHGRDIPQISDEQITTYKGLSQSASFLFPVKPEVIGTIKFASLQSKLECGASI